MSENLTNLHKTATFQTFCKAIFAFLYVNEVGERWWRTVAEVVGCEVRNRFWLERNGYKLG